MKNKQIFLMLAMAFIVIICGASLLYGSLGDRISNYLPSPDASDSDTHAGTSDSSAQEERMIAPDFTVYTSDGTAVKLSDMRGKPVVLNFWSSRCGPCKAEMPVFEHAYSYLNELVNFMMVNVTDNRYWDTLDTAKEFMSENDYTFPVYYDTDQTASVTYGTNSLPITFFIDAEGALVYYHTGQMDINTLVACIELSIR